jgi:hypothetical protein
MIYENFFCMNCYSAIFLAVMHIPCGEEGFIGFVQKCRSPTGYGEGESSNKCVGLLAMDCVVVSTLWGIV